LRRLWPHTFKQETMNTMINAFQSENIHETLTVKKSTTLHTLCQNRLCAFLVKIFWPRSFKISTACHKSCFTKIILTFQGKIILFTKVLESQQCYHLSANKNLNKSENTS
jgi:hypothetical protein